MARTAINLRLIRFGSVGALCAIFQLLVNAFLLGTGQSAIVAFSGSFIISAQLNFVLSNRFTWGSRRLPSMVWRRSAKRWLSFNASSLVALGVSSLVFAFTDHFTGDKIAVLCGIAASGLLTFFIGDRFVFASREGRTRTGLLDLTAPILRTVYPSKAVPSTPGLAPPLGDSNPAGVSAVYGIPLERLSAMLGRGIAMFLPCFNESENLPSVVLRTLTALEDVGVPHQVIIVDDGSHDRTALVASELAEIYGGRVTVVSHERNLGYGDALRSGFAAGVTGGWDWVGFMDSDNQFDPDEIKEMIAAAYYEHVDLVAGYRIKRADGLGRRLIGRMWHLLTRCVVGIRERDVDCGFKLVHRNVLNRIELRGSFAAVSPELLVKSRNSGFQSAEVGVRHYPRTAGEQSGADLRVIVRSLMSLFVLRWSLSRLRPMDQSSAGDRRSGRVPTSGLGIGLTAAALSIAGFLFFYLRGQTLAYDDSVSHLLIARRLLGASTPGVAQLGSVWLPLPHLLVQPFIWSDSLLYSGIAGSLLSMIAFVAAAVFLFKTAVAMTGSSVGGWVAGLIFVCNPNMLYLQSTPMTETLLFACMAGAVYQLVLWSQNERWQNLAGAASAIFLASLTRYEGWVLLGSFVLIVFYVTVRRSYRRDRVIATLIFFLLLAAAGVAGWLLWNRVIFGSFTDFSSGQFAKPSLWVGKADVAVGHVRVSIETYLLAITDTVGVPVVILGSAGLIVYLGIGRLRPEFSAPLTMLVFVPFFIVALYTGQRPLHVTQISGDLYNVRFGLVMLLPVALFAAYLLVHLGRQLTAALRREQMPRTTVFVRRLGGSAIGSAVVLLVVTGTLISGGVLTLDEPLHWERGRADLTAAAAALHSDYDGGRLLMEGFGNEYVAFTSRVPAGNTIYEGSYRLWQAALTNPLQQNIRWIFLSRVSSDLVWQALGKSTQLARYRVRFDDGTRVLYEKE